jgi:hypothetical protein
MHAWQCAGAARLHEVDGLDGVGLDGLRAVLEEQRTDDARVVRLHGQNRRGRAQVGRVDDEGRRAAVRGHAHVLKQERACAHGVRSN